MGDDMKFNRIKDLREDADLTQEDIARMLDTTQENYSRYERGTRDIPVRHLITLAKFYRVSTDYLLGLSNETGKNETKKVHITQKNKNTKNQTTHFNF